jgi:hypothetical protein
MRSPLQTGVLSVSLTLLVGASLSGCGQTGEGSSKVDTECEAGLLNECDEEEAADSLEWSDVSCRWKRSDVVVEATAKSDFNATLDVSLIPRYTIEKGGQHGTAFGSEEHKTIKPGGEVTFSINAGSPKGVPDGANIEKCNPKVYDVDLAD